MSKELVIVNRQEYVCVRASKSYSMIVPDIRGGMSEKEILDFHANIEASSVREQHTTEP